MAKTDEGRDWLEQRKRVQMHLDDMPWARTCKDMIPVLWKFLRCAGVRNLCCNATAGLIWTGWDRDTVPKLGNADWLKPKYDQTWKRIVLLRLIHLRLRNLIHEAQG